MNLLRNECPPGSDDVGNELFILLPFAEIINAIIQQHITLEALDKGILVALHRLVIPLAGA